MKKIYIAGPMTGLPEFNYPAFNKAALELREKGYHVESPAENTEPSGTTWSGYMRMAITKLVKCDIIVLMPKWWKSRGAITEFLIAWRIGMKIVRLSTITEKGYEP